MAQANDELIVIAFVCTGNAARSQMAEGMVRAWAVDNVHAESAGTCPAGLSSRAVEVMVDIGIDISGHHSKDVSQLTDPLDYVITLCDHAARDCPRIPARLANIHWSLPDPDSAGPIDDALDVFRRVRDDLARRVRSFLAEHGLLKQS